MGDNLVQWSDLPKELLPIIGKSLETSVDVLRFRSVCNSWRSSLPPFSEISPRLPLTFPWVRSGVLQAFVSQSTIYRLEPPPDDNPSSSTSSSSSSSNGWLIKIEESEAGKIRLLSPLSNLQIRYLDPVSFPKVLNLLDFRILELSKAYKLQYLGGTSIVGVNKVLLFPNSAWSRVEDSVIFVLYDGGKLGSAKYGDKKWTLIDEQNSHYDDIIVYKGQFYVVDRLGSISWIDSSLKLIPFSPPLCGLGDQKHLVESCGELYVVDRFLDRERRFVRYHGENNNHNIGRYHSCPKTVNFEVYKLDEEWGKWVMVKNLGDRVFILGNDCSFSVSGREFARCKGNCIYFTDENDIGVFCLEDRSRGKIIDFPDYSHIFWPPPTWLRPNQCSYEC